MAKMIQDLFEKNFDFSSLLWIMALHEFFEDTFRVELERIFFSQLATDRGKIIRVCFECFMLLEAFLVAFYDHHVVFRFLTKKKKKQTKKNDLSIK